MIWGRTVALVNGSGMSSIRFASRVLAIDEPPRRGDAVIDLEGAFVIPGLVNAHDHLELNHYGRLKFRERYTNATEWIDDMRPQLSQDAAIRAAQRHSLTDRLFIGALKNLLAGVTTVAHHNPRYTELRRTMPLRVVRRYGWAHSFALEHRPAGARGEPGGDVAQRWRRTSADVPFFVHVGEGVDAVARAELDELERRGCLAANTVLIHGVAFDTNALHRIAEAGAALVWCPASNIFLFGRTAGIRPLVDVRPGHECRVALGSDSRLTGSRDLLDELRIARGTHCASPLELFEMVTVNAARILRLRDAGRLAVGGPADLIVIPKAGASAATALLATHRKDVALVVVGGRPYVGDPRYAAAFAARGVIGRPLVVDGCEKLADSGLARRIAASPIAEPRVEVRRETGKCVSC
jgi:cytosine/adenosine deaminase-related metal-dependent hydrolase